MANPKRQKVETFILKHMSMIDPSNTNTERYKKFFASLSDAEFDEFMQNLRSGEEQLFIYVPNLKVNLTTDNILKAADSLGLDLYEQLWIKDDATGNTYLTPQKYLILSLPVRRVKQYQDHKMSVPEGDSKIDLLSGQVVKPDAAASISLVEMQALAARGLPNLIAELVKYRGGDIKAYSAMKQSLEETGSASVTLEDTGTIARSAQILEIYLKGMHIQSNLTNQHRQVD